MTLQVLSLYPLTDAFRRKLEGAVGAPLQPRIVGEFRHPGLWATWRALRTLGNGPLILASEDPAAESVMAILVTVGGLFGKGPLRCYDHLLRETRPRRWEAVRGLFRIVVDTLRARRLNHIISRRLRETKGSWRPLPWRGGDRVAYLKTNLWFGVKAGGSVGHVAGVVNALHKEGQQVEVHANESQPLVLPDIPFLGVHPPGLCAYPSELNLVTYHQAFLEQTRVRLKANPVDWIYQRLSTANFAGAELSRELSLPLVVEYNGSEVWIAKNWGRGLRNEAFALEAEDAMLRQATLVVAVSEVLGEELRDRGIPSERILVHPNCVDPDLFRPDVSDEASQREARVGLGIDPGALVFTFIGTFGPWHGVEVLVEALQTLFRDAPEWWEANRIHILMVGDGALRSAAQDGLAGVPRVTFTGLVPQDQAPRVLAVSDVFLSPHQDRMTGQRFFGSPTKLFEYLAMGRAVLASSLEQISEICSPALTPNGQATGQEVAMLFPPGDIGQLMAGIRRLAEDTALRAQLGRQGRVRALQSFTWNAYIKSLRRKLSTLGGEPVAGRTV